MVEILPFSQSSLLLSSRPSPLCSPRRAHLLNCSRASLTITSPTRFSPTKPITFSTSQAEQTSTTARVVSDCKVPTTFTVDSAGGGYDILRTRAAPETIPAAWAGMTVVVEAAMVVEVKTEKMRITVGPRRKNRACLNNKVCTTAMMTGRTTLQAREHVVAERKCRENLSQLFISLSQVVPGLKKALIRSVCE